MKRQLLKIVSAGLSLCLLLSGCGGGDANSDKPMGRYVEEQIHQFDGAGQISGIKTQENGDIGFYYTSYNEDGTSNEVLSGTMSKTGKEIQTEKSEWLSGLVQEGFDIQDIAVGPDGAVYALYFDKERTPHLVKSTDGKTFSELSILEWQQGTKDNGSSDSAGTFAQEGGEFTIVSEESNGEISIAGGDSGLSPDRLFVLDNGDLLITYPFTSGDARRYSGTDGSFLKEYPIGGNQAAVYQNSLVALSQDMAKIVEYDLGTGNVIHEYEYDGVSWGTYLGIDKDGIFVADASGLSRTTIGGSIWERIIDGGLTSMNIPTMMLMQMISDENGGYYGIFSTGGDEMEMKIMRYTYSADTPTNPDTELTIFGLKRNNTIRQAIGEFQQQNPNVRVNYRVAMEDDSSATVEDVIKALNTELLAGKAPDLLLLDGLPIESYIEKGVLADITDLVKELTTSEGLFENIMNAFAKDGKIYGVPAKFTVPVLVGDNAVLDSFSSLSDIANVAKPREADTAETFRTPDGIASESLLSDYYDYFVNDWLSGKEIDEAKLISFLTDIQNINQKMKVANGDQAVMGGMVISAMTVDGGGEILPLGAMDIGQGKVKSDIEQVGGLSSLGFILQNIQDRDNMGMRSLFGKNEYTPLSGVGIVTSSKQQDLAKEFLKTLLSSQVQDKNLGDGLPVNEQSLQKGMEKNVKDLKLESGNDLGFLELCQNLTTPISVDYVIKETVLSIESELLKGTLTPQDAAKKIIEDTEIYRSE